MALARMANEEQIKWVRSTQIEQERIKLTSAQGKRLVPIFLDLLNDANDLEYVFSVKFFIFRFLILYHLAPRLNTPSRTWVWTSSGSRCRP